jgi:hypothetical protein
MHFLDVELTQREQRDLIIDIARENIYSEDFLRNILNMTSDSLYADQPEFRDYLRFIFREFNLGKF